MKKFAITTTILTCILLILPLGLYGYVKYKFYVIEKETYEYLINDKGYDQNEIYQVESKLGFGQLFVAKVIFEDEKNVFYEYANVGGEIKQITPDDSINNYKYKHRE